MNDQRTKINEKTLGSMNERMKWQKREGMEWRERGKEERQFHRVGTLAVNE